MKPTMTEIIAIGNELLIGDVLDSNTQWLCKRITGLGGRVIRSTMIRDDRKAIADVLYGALERETEVIFTTGGLGPTTDDMTLSAIANALDVPLHEDLRALQMVQETYSRLMRQGYVDHEEMTKERRKMARLPEESEPLFNPVGAAPGVLLEFDNSTIICLPGVPEEMKGIVEGSLAPHLASLYGEGYYAERVVRVDCGDESVLAPIVSHIAERHGEVYVKSRAKAFGPDVQLMITLSAGGSSREEVEPLLDSAVDELKGGLEEQGVGIVEIK